MFLLIVNKVKTQVNESDNETDRIPTVGIRNPNSICLVVRFIHLGFGYNQNAMTHIRDVYRGRTSAAAAPRG
jgi:hypothetical protein